MVDSGQHVFDRSRSDGQLLVSDLVDNSGGHRPAPRQVDARLRGELRQIVRSAQGALVDQIEARAELIRQRVEPGSRDADVDHAFDRDSCGILDSRLVLGHVSTRGHFGRVIGVVERTDALGGKARERKVRLHHGREGEVSPQDVALRPLRARARAVGERESDARLEVASRPLAELDLQRLLALRHLWISRRQRRGEEEACTQQRLLPPIDRLRSEDVSLLEADQVEHQSFHRPAMTDHLDVPDANDGPGLDAVADVDA